MSKERKISSEQILYYLIQEKKEQNESSYKNIIINESKCKSLGLFSYKDKQTNEVFAGELFLICEIQDGKEVNIIYDEKGKVIAWKQEENRMKLQIAKNIELNENQLLRQVDLGEERTANISQNNSSSDTSKAGEGRDLATKEHEQENPPKQNESKNTPEKNEEKFLTNLKYEINIDNKPKIRLDEIINGHYLWEILQLEYKLKDILPEGVDVKEFRVGYLTIVDSEELTMKDGKPRNSVDTFVISTLDGDIIELNEDILKPKELGSSEQRQDSEQNRLRYANGEEADKPYTNVDTTRTSLYQIPDVNRIFNVDENWYLGVDTNRAWQENREMPVAGHTKEISFVQASRQEEYFYREERIQNTLEYKLKPINENNGITGHEKEEKEQLEQLRKKDAYETQNVREEHTQELVNECCAKYKNWNDYYNKSDITQKVEQYHNEGMNDDEVIEQVGNDIGNAERFEHDRSPFHKNS